MTVKLISLLSCLIFNMDENIHAHVPSKVLLVCVVTAFAAESIVYHNKKQHQKKK